MVAREVIHQGQQLARQTPQVGILEPLVIAQGLVQQGDALRIGIDKRVDCDGRRPVVQGEHGRQQNRRHTRLGNQGLRERLGSVVIGK